MFWDDAGALNSLQQLLQENKEAPLDQILDDSFVLQEARQGNEELLELLTTEDNLLTVLKHALRPDVDETLPIEEQYVLSNLCTDLLTVASHNCIVNALWKNEKCVELLGSMLDDPNDFNPVLGIFYTRIISFLLSKNFAPTLAFMKQTMFLEKSQHFIRFGAITDLLESLIRLNSDEQNILEMKTFLTEEKFIPKIVGLLDSSTDLDVHEYAADIYIDILRNLREILAVNDDKSDVLHDVFMEPELIAEILERMFRREDHDGMEIGQEKRASLLMNGMSMVSALMEANALGPAPSQLFEAGAEGNESWGGGGPGEVSVIFDRSRMWLPDREKTAEMLIARRAADMVRVTIEDLEMETAGDAWPWMLKLLNELADTNHLPTHQALVEGFKEAGFQRLFNLVWKHPLVHIFHHLLRNIVTYALFSDFKSDPETVSPLVEYFINDCELFGRLKTGVWPVTELPKMTMMSMRSFHVYMADSFVMAAKWAPRRAAIAAALGQNADWTADDELSLAKGLEAYWEKNRPDEYEQPSQTTSQRSTARERYVHDINDEIDAFNRFECSQEFVDFEPLSAGPTSILHNFVVRTPHGHDSSMHIDLHERDAREADFEAAEKFIPLTQLFPSLKSSSSSREEDEVEPSRVCISGKQAAKDEEEENGHDASWPGTEPNTSNGTDDWADFTSNRLSNGSNSSTDEWSPFNNSVSSTSSSTTTAAEKTECSTTSTVAKARGSFDGVDFAAFQQEAMDCLDNSVKSDDQDSIWDSSPPDTISSPAWQAKFTGSSSPKPHAAATAADESEA